MINNPLLSSHIFITGILEGNEQKKKERHTHRRESEEKHKQPTLPSSSYLLSFMYSEDWQALGDVQYRKWDIYDPMGWEGGSTFLDDFQVDNHNK